jgi:hypothetical protein
VGAEVQSLLELDPQAYLIFELDTVLDKSFDPRIGGCPSKQC